MYWTADWKLETGDWRLAFGDRIATIARCIGLQTGNWRPATDLHAKKPALDVEKISIFVAITIYEF